MSSKRNGASVEGELARVARRIRSWRVAEGYTLQELARRSGVATSTIQKVETFQMVPTVTVLLKIAHGLGRSASEFVSSGPPATEAVHRTRRERQAVGSPSRMVVERLSADLAEGELELWRVEVQPGYGSGRGVLAYRGEALVLCERGEVTFRVGDRQHRLRLGDTLHFKATIPHAWYNDGPRAARFLILGTVPTALQERLGQGADPRPGGRRGPTRPSRARGPARGRAR
ncbi:MAG: helix-turn-helix domain-containing protein [Myxococcota bacterium]